MEPSEREIVEVLAKAMGGVLIENVGDQAIPLGIDMPSDEILFPAQSLDHMVLIEAEIERRRLLQGYFDVRWNMAQEQDNASDKRRYHAPTPVDIFMLMDRQPAFVRARAAYQVLKENP